MKNQPPAITQSLVIFAKDRSRVSQFYQQTLALEVTATDERHNLLHGDGIELLIHAIDHRNAADIAIQQPPRQRHDTPSKPAFCVASLVHVQQHAEACGGGLQPLQNAWTLRGTRVLDGWDPEGNIVQFRELPG